MAGNKFYDNAVLLLSAEFGFLDMSSSGHTVTSSGIALSSTAKYGTQSFSNTNNSGYMSVVGQKFIPATGDFTLEFWFRPGSLSSSHYALFQGTTNSNFLSVSFSNPLDRMVLNVGNFGGVFSSNYSIHSTNSWFFITVTRSGNVFNLYVNGVLQGSETWGATLSVNEDTKIFYPFSFSGTAYIDDIAIYNTVTRTENFTPPTEGLRTYPLNDKLIPRKELQRKQPTKLNQNYFIHRRGL